MHTRDKDKFVLLSIYPSARCFVPATKLHKTLKCYLSSLNFKGNVGNVLSYIISRAVADIKKKVTVCREIL